jgi:NADH-quinone oxidoreductase subunit C
MSDTLTALAEHIGKKLGSKIKGNSIAFGELTLVTDAASIIDVMTFLRDDPKCAFCSFVDAAGADYPGREQRFEVIYHLMSPTLNHRIRIKLQTGEDDVVPSVTGVFKGAEWFEREAYDLYGILFTGHPDLRRILTDYGFEGYPLRKDFPTTGFVEVRYDDEVKRVVYEPVELRQEFRQFDFLSPWEGTDYVLPGDEKAKQ